MLDLISFVWAGKGMTVSLSHGGVIKRPPGTPVSVAAVVGRCKSIDMQKPQPDRLRLSTLIPRQGRAGGRGESSVPFSRCAARGPEQ